MAKRVQKPNIVETARKKRHLHLLQKLKSEKSLSPKEIEELSQFENTKETAGFNWRELNQSITTKILSLTPHTLNKWISNGCPHEKKKGSKVYDCGKILKWRIEYQKEMDGIDGEMGATNSDAAEEYRRVRAEAARFDLDIKKGLYVHVDEVESKFRDAGDYVRMHFQTMSKEISKQLAKEDDPDKLEEILTAECEKVLERMGRAPSGGTT